MKLNKDKINRLASLEEVEDEIFSKEEADEIRESAKTRSLARRAMSEEISKVIASYMANEGIGFNEFQRRLGVSSATVSKLLKGDCNVTLETISSVSQLIGVMPELSFKKTIIK